MHLCRVLLHKVQFQKQSKTSGNKEKLLSYFYYNHNPVDMFLQDARKYVNHQGTKRTYVEFSPYWYHNVSYRNLTPPQQDWYFYWRSHLRNGEFLPNDLSYIFLYAYEVLNMIGFDTAENAYKQLVSIWQNYRQMDIPIDRYEWFIWSPKTYLTVKVHPVDRYLVDWIADFIFMHQLPIDLLDWYSIAASEGAVLSNLHLMVEAWLRTNKSMIQMPNEILFALAHYDPTSNKFFQDYKQIYNLSSVYTIALLAVHSYLEKIGKGSKHLFARINRKHMLKRSPFERAPHKYSSQRIPILELPAQVKQKTLSTNLTGIIKYTDNLFRQRAGFRAKLRGFEIPEVWQTAIDSAFEIKPDPITIDYSRVSEISERSESIRERLITELLEVSSQDSESELSDSTSSYEESEEADNSAERLRKFRLIFVALENNDWHVLPTELQQWSKNTFISILIDEFNEWGFENLGDTPIILDEDGYYTVIEDYREEIATLLNDLL